jgi:excisionase family DNA binding protein
MKAPTLPEVLTPDDVALWLGLPLGRVLKLARANQVPHVRLPDGSVLFDRTDLRQWLETLRGQQKGAAHVG